MAWIESLLGPLELELLGKLLLASVLGGLVGWERESSDKPAGLRTNLLICVGATLLTHVSVGLALGVDPASHVRADPARIAAQIVSGIGFLGAGTIIQARGSVTGLTTAATLWVVAAIGIAIGSASYVAAVGTTILVLLALVPLGWLEDRIEARRTGRKTFRLVVSHAEGVVSGLEELLRTRGLEPDVQKVEKDVGRERMILHLGARGDPDDLRGVRERLLARTDVHELTVLEIEPD